MKKKIDRLGDLPQFSGEEKVGHDIIGQGTFGLFLQIRNHKPLGTIKKSPAENVAVKKLLSTAQDFTETVIKEAKILRELQHNNIVSFKAICKEPMAMMSDFPF